MNKILVVEDEQSILNLVRISLKEASYECIGTMTEIILGGSYEVS